MVRAKLEMKRIEKDSNRQVTFAKRRAGLFKKAFQLAVLCDSEVALIIFSNTGKLFEFASKSVKETIERYKKHMNMKHPEGFFSGGITEEGMDEAAVLRNRIKSLETSKQRLMGVDLDSCSLDELQEQEDQLENALANVKTTMSKVVSEQMEQFKEKESSLAQENAQLREQLELLEVQTLQATADKGELESNTGRSEDRDLETELFLGLPESRK